MRLYRLNKNVEFPEKTKDGYINIRSVGRIDVRPNEELDITTGLRLTKSASERVSVKSAWGDVFEIEKSGKELCVRIHNHGIRVIMIHPGMVVGEIAVEKI